MGFGYANLRFYSLAEQCQTQILQHHKAVNKLNLTDTNITKMDLNIGQACNNFEFILVQNVICLSKCYYIQLLQSLRGLNETRGNYLWPNITNNHFALSSDVQYY